MTDQTSRTGLGPWEKAYLKQSMDAVVGRLFRGLIHNMNGTIQVFSLQAELLGMMMNKATPLAARLEQLCTEGEPAALAKELLEILQKRENAVPQMKEKVQASQETLHRTLILPDFRQIPGLEQYTINSVIKTEVEFLCADSFFKHQVEKNLELDESLTPLTKHYLELHEITHILLSNALDAMQGQDGAAIGLKTVLQDDMVTVGVTDNGPGIDPAMVEQLYEPFHSSKEGHAGVGLYLARHLAAQMGGELEHSSTPGQTIFVLRVPAGM